MNDRQVLDLARGRECTIRLADICNFDTATTVAAHFRMIDISGLGLKSPPIFIAFACSDCHDAVDRRSHKDLDRDFVRLAHLEGVIRTQAILIREKVLRW